MPTTKARPMPAIVARLRTSVHLAAVLGALVVLVLGGLVWWRAGLGYRERLMADRREQVQSILGPYGNGLTNAINRNLARLDGLQAFVTIDPSEERLDKGFATYASGLTADISSVRTLAIAPAGGNGYVDR